MANLQQINVESIKIPSDISKNLWNNHNITKEKLQVILNQNNMNILRKVC